MKKKFKMENLDCANCAAKMEEAVKKIEGVKDASVNFMMQKMTVEISDDCSMDQIMEEAQKLCKKIEPDCKIIL